MEAEDALATWRIGEPASLRMEPDDGPLLGTAVRHRFRRPRLPGLPSADPRAHRVGVEHPLQPLLDRGRNSFPARTRRYGVAGRVGGPNPRPPPADRTRVPPVSPGGTPSLPFRPGSR